MYITGAFMVNTGALVILTGVQAVHKYCITNISEITELLNKKQKQKLDRCIDYHMQICKKSMFDRVACVLMCSRCNSLQASSVEILRLDCSKCV